jgi:hypothetical protein
VAVPCAPEAPLIPAPAILCRRPVYLLPRCPLPRHPLAPPCTTIHHHHSASSSLPSGRLRWAPNSPKLAVATPERPVIYCCNHRGWADNGIDGEITGAPYTSRWLVAAAFPFTAVIALLDGGELQPRPPS